MFLFRYIVLITFTLHFTYSKTLLYSAFTESILSDLGDWHFININSVSVVSNCGSEEIVGGYRKFGYEKAAMIFLSLPPHYRIKISFKLFIIDLWDANEFFQVFIDKELVYNETYSGVDATSDLCGMIYNGEQIHDIEKEVDHFGSTVNLYLTSTLNNLVDGGSWGFKNFRLFVYLCPSGCLICTSKDLQTSCVKWVLYQSFYTEIDSNLFSESGWIINNGLSKKRNRCNTIPIICGYEICGQNTILQLSLKYIPAHTKMKIKLKYLKINSWDSGELAYLNVDGETKWSKTLKSSKQYIYFDCGTKLQEVFINVEVTFDHSQMSALIEILNNLDQNYKDESFGIRDIEIFIEQIICGDEIVQFSEDCDDGNLFPFDGCFNCQYQCVEGCSLCYQGICLSCFSGWDYQIEQSICQEITHSNYISQISLPNLQNELYQYTVLQCQNGFQLNQISGECESICGDNFVTNYEECDIESEYCHECKFQCSLNCEVCQFGICYVCKQDYFLKNNYCLMAENINICQPECAICIQSTCYKCQSGQILILGQCQEICGNNNMAIYTLEECSCDVNCQDCFVGVCSNCKVNYNLINNICATCGDQIIQGNEECDDGNNIQFDGCYLCQNSCDKSCSDCLNGICIACYFGYELINNKCIYICGNRLLQSEEQCDDGNQESADGCSKTCQVESNWICNQGTECTFVQYPIFQTEYIMQNNQYQYVKISFSQPVQSYSNNSYKDTIEFEILNLNQTLYNIIIIEVQPVQFYTVSEVSYILEIEISTNLNYKPTLKVNLTEQLFNSDNAPLINTIDFQQLYQPQYITQSEIRTAQVLQMISKISLFSIFGSSIILIILGNTLTFWGVLDALQQQSYLKFINVIYPQTLIIYFQSSDLLSVEQLIDNTKINKIDKVLSFPYLESYEKFKYYEVNSNIIEGLKTELLVFAILLIFYLISVIFIQIVNIFEISENMLRYPKFIRLLQKYQRKIHNRVIKNNVNLVQNTFFACSWDLIFMSFLEINTNHNFQYYRQYVRRTMAFLILVIILLFLLNQIKGIMTWKKQNFHQFWRKKKEFFFLILNIHYEFCILVLIALIKQFIKVKFQISLWFRFQNSIILLQTQLLFPKSFQ